METETLTPEEARHIKLHELALERRRLEILKDAGLAFYRPFDKQSQFHAAGDRKHRMVCSGNRFGKSTMGCAEDVAWMLGERTWLAQTDPLRRLGIPQRPVKGLVITTDWDKVDEIWTSQRGANPGKFWKMAPKGFVVDQKRNHSGAIETIVGANGSILRFDTVESFKKNPQGGESSDWDFVHVDEPCPEEQYKAAARGLVDRNGKDWFTLTPLTEFWINDMFFPAHGVTSKFSPAEIWAIRGHTSDNPFNTPEAIESFAKLLTDDEKQCRLAGIPLELSGLVYKTFAYPKHVLQKLPKGWTDYDKPPKDYIIYVSIDVHPQTPHAVLFTAVAPTGQAFLYDEIYWHTSIDELAKLILHKLKGYYYNVPKCDPIAWINDPITESCIAEEFAKSGLFVEKASKGKTHGILKMQGEFKKDGYLYVSPNLTRWLFEIHRYCYDKENKPIDKDDHMMECMYRTFINDPIWYNPDTASTPVGHESFDKPQLDLGRVTTDIGGLSLE